MNIVLTNNAKFNPYTFDELVKPLSMAEEAYEKVQSGIEELGAKADLMKMYANEVPDSNTANMYNSYARDLEKQASMLAKYGLTPGSRNKLSEMKKRYNSEIVPIETAIKQREALTKEQREAMLKDPSLMFDINYANTQLDYLLENPNATYNAISGNELTRRSAEMASALAKTLQGNPKYEPLLKGQYFQQMQQLGYTPQQIMSVILNDPGAPAELKQIVDTVYQEAGLDKYSKEIQDRSRNYINAGLYKGIGSAKYDVIADKSYTSPAENKRLLLAQDELTWKKEHSSKDIELGNGKILRQVGNKLAVIDQKSGEVKLIGDIGKGDTTATTATTSTEAKRALNNASTVDSSIVVAKVGGKWQGKVPDASTRIGGPSDFEGVAWRSRSKLASHYGNATLENIDKAIIVSGKDLESIPKEAAYKLQKFITDKKLDMSNHYIIAVEAKAPRGGDRYDYAVVPKSMIDDGTIKLAETEETEGTSINIFNSNGGLY